jgi:GntR family transcriptional regulator
MKEKDEITEFIYRVQPSSGVPIYRQIIEQVKRLVASGRLEPGAELPSVRKTASFLEVNPMTISKAYSLLEAEGITRRLVGKGMIISPRTDSIESSRKRLELLKPLACELVRQSRQLNLTGKEVSEYLGELWKEG